MVYEILSMIGSLLLIVVVLALTWYGTRWYARRVGQNGSGKHIRILERASLGSNSSVAIVKVGDRYYLVGVGDKNVNLLCELEDFEEPPDVKTEETQSMSQAFRQILDKARGEKDQKKDGEPRP